MTCVVRIEALEAFTALVESQIPALVGRTCAGQAPSGELEKLPNLSIEPTRWMYAMDQAAQTATLPGNVVVYDVGNHEASCVVSIMATSPRQRATLEQQVIDLFLSSKHPLTGMHMPGVIAFLISNCPEVSRWSSSFELDSDEWVETLAMDRRYESRMIVNATIPALTVDSPVYTMTALIMGVDVTPTPTDATTAPPVGDPTVELITINADGTITRSAP